MKIKSTAQQEEEKRKEREKKLKIYVAARDACFSKVGLTFTGLDETSGIYVPLCLKKTQCLCATHPSCSPTWQRKEGIWDDEALQLTQQLLSSNPDFATLWNYRREILMHLETVKLDH